MHRRSSQNIHKKYTYTDQKNLEKLFTCPDGPSLHWTAKPINFFTKKRLSPETVFQCNWFENRARKVFRVLFIGLPCTFAQLREAATAHAPFLPPSPFCSCPKSPDGMDHGGRPAPRKEAELEREEGRSPVSTVAGLRWTAQEEEEESAGFLKDRWGPGGKVLDWINAVDLQNNVLHCTTVSKSKRQSDNRSVQETQKQLHVGVFKKGTGEQIVRPKLFFGIVSRLERIKWQACCWTE